MSEEEEVYNDYVFVCTECHSDQRMPPSRADTNPWVSQGMTPPCRYCGGVVEYLDDRQYRDTALQQRDRERGIDK